MLYRKSIAILFYWLTGCIATMQAQSQKIIADKIVATVGDRIILYSDIKNTGNFSTQGENSSNEAECTTLERAIISKLLALQAEKDSLPVNEKEIEDELDQKIRYYINQLGSKEVLEEYAGKTIYQLKDDAWEQTRERRLAEAMQQKILSGVRITPAEVRIFFDNIPPDSLPFIESELEVGQVILYPAASRDMEQYVITELSNYKKKIESNTATLCMLNKIIEGPGNENGCRDFTINRNDKTWDPDFMSAAFRLKDGEISNPIKTKSGIYLIQLIRRESDDAIVRYMLRVPPVTEAEIAQVKAKMDTVRLKLITGSINFSQAASNYSEDEIAKFSPFFLNDEGSPHVTINQLDKDIVDMIGKLNIGDISQPVIFTNDKNKKGFRIIYLKSRSEAHRMNLRDDYTRISGLALEEKRRIVLDKWLKESIPACYIMVDIASATDCPNVKELTSRDSKGF